MGGRLGGGGRVLYPGVGVGGWGASRRRRGGSSLLVLGGVGGGRRKGGSHGLLGKHLHFISIDILGRVRA